MQDISVDAIAQLDQWAQNAQTVFVASHYMSERLETVWYRGHLIKAGPSGYVLKPGPDGALYGVQFDTRFGVASLQPTAAGPKVHIQASKYVGQGEIGHGLDIMPFAPF
jgi:hypothetical protein